MRRTQRRGTVSTCRRWKHLGCGCRKGGHSRSSPCHLLLHSLACSFNSSTLALISQLLVECCGPDVEVRCLQFYYHMFGADTGSLKVSSCAGPTCTERFSVQGEQHASSQADWTEVTLSLPAGTTSVVWTATRHGTSVASDISVDSITIEENTAAIFSVSASSPAGACVIDRGCATDGAGSCRFRSRARYCLPLSIREMFCGDFGQATQPTCTYDGSICEQTP